VERLELAVRVPPFGGHRLELGHFGGIDGIGCALHRLHLFESSRLGGGNGALYRSIMDKVAGQKSAGQFLYPQIDPFDQRMLDVGDGHRIYVEQCGNPDGVPVIVLHGGPGGGCSPAMRRYFDPPLPDHPVRPARLRPVAAACERGGQHDLAPRPRHRAHPQGDGRRPLDRLRRQLGRDAGADLRADPSRAGAAPRPARRVPDDAGASSTGSTAAARGSSGPTSGSASSTRSPRTSATT
jgi:hypothetical protein